MISGWSAWARIPVLLGLFMVFDRWLYGVAQLPEETFYNSVLAPAVFLQWSVLVAVGLGLVAWFRVPELRRNWSAWESGGWLRALAVVALFTLVWAYSTYAYNFYFDRSHGVDRVLLVALGLLAVWHPITLILFLLQLMAVVGQFAHPLSNFMWVVPMMAWRMLLVLWVAWMLRPILGPSTARDALFLVGCVVASNYWWHGFGKFELGWLSHGQLHLGFAGAYSQGWMGHWSPESIAEWTARLKTLDWPLRLATYAFELGAVFFLWKRGVALVFLLGWVGFHLGVLAFLGFAFWQWALLDLAMFAVLLKAPNAMSFGWPQRVLSTVIILAAAWTIPPATKLSWFDTPVYEGVRYRAVSEDAETIWGVHDFAPYGDPMNLAGWNFLRQQASLTGPYGVTRNGQLATHLLSVRTPEEVAKLRAAVDRPSPYDEKQAAAFDRFVRRYASVGYSRKMDRGWWYVVSPPATLQSFVNGARYDGSYPIDTIVVEGVPSFFDGEKLHIDPAYSIREISIRAEESP